MVAETAAYAGGEAWLNQCVDYIDGNLDYAHDYITRNLPLVKTGVKPEGTYLMWLDVNGIRRQTGSTSRMIFDPYFIVHYISQFLVLEPGDLINTGTPPGVGMGFKPPVWLQAGDVMELGIEHLGSQRQAVLEPR